MSALLTSNGQLFVMFGMGLILTFLLIFNLSPAFLFETTEDQLIHRVEIQRKLSTKVAFVADAGLNQASRMVLELLRDEQVDMVIHSGDLDYSGKAAEFYASIDQVLGHDFPYFVSMGNYESKRGSGREVAWNAYQRLQKERLKRIPGMKCSVVSSRNLACYLHGISFITSAIGVNYSRLGLDLREIRQASNKLWGNDASPVSGTDYKSSWKFCSWHLPLANFQVGFREGVPWMSSAKFVEAHELCRQRGAIVVTGHEHYYVRSHAIKRFSLTEVEFQHVRKRAVSLHLSNTSKPVHETVERIDVGPGSTFTAVSGLGGHSVSIPSKSKQRLYAHLAVVHPSYLAKEDDDNNTTMGKYFFPAVTGRKSITSSEQINLNEEPEQGYPFGALICLLQNSAVPRARGQCYFKTVRGKVVDKFNLARF